MLDRLALTLRLLPALPKLAGHRPTSHFTVTNRLEHQAKRRGARTAVRFEGRSLSWEQLNARANRVAHWALEQGLGHGDVVALLMENRPEYIETWAGLAKLGVTTALINTNLGGHALEHAIETASAKLLVVGRECLDPFASAPGLAERGGIWLRSDPGIPRETPAPGGSHDLDAALENAPVSNPSAQRRRSLVAGDPLFYIYTSGTTGLPKAAILSHMRFFWAGELTAFALSLTPEDVFYCALPLYHTAGGVMLVGACLSVGATVALRRRFSASHFWDDIREVDATCFQYIGEFCRYLLNQAPHPRDRDHRVRAIIGNGLRPDIWPAFQQRFGIENIREFYGATEGNTALINLENKIGSVGRMPHRAFTNARLIHYDVENDAPVRGLDGFCIECKPDEVGELVGRIPSNPNVPTGRFEGYTSKEASDRKTLRDVFHRGDAYIRSGDLLRMDRDGFFYFVDRIGDTFRWKGENVSTQEVAELLSEFPGLELVNVYGVEVPGADGRVGMAALLMDRGADFDGRAFFAHVEERLPRYAAPHFVRLLAKQEMTSTFKIRKVDLQREGFDPSAISDPLLLRDEQSRSYVPLTGELHAELRAGRRAL